MSTSLKPRLQSKSAGKKPFTNSRLICCRIKNPKCSSEGGRDGDDDDEESHRSTIYIVTCHDESVLEELKDSGACSSNGPHCVIVEVPLLNFFGLDDGLLRSETSLLCLLAMIVVPRLYTGNDACSGRRRHSCCGCITN